MGLCETSPKITDLLLSGCFCWSTELEGVLSSTSRSRSCSWCLFGNWREKTKPNGLTDWDTVCLLVLKSAFGVERLYSKNAVNLLVQALC